MFFVFRKNQLILSGLLAVTALGLSALLWQGKELSTFSASMNAGKMIVVLDPGHGGEDGGAVSGSGTVESLLNLTIARQLREVLVFLGQEVAMTRETDISIYSEGAKTLHEKKVSDLHNRATLVNDLENSLLLSIHQNSMPSAPSVRGAQVFYNTVPGGETLAKSIQIALNKGVNDEKGKSSKQISSSIFLMKQVARPGVLVECGFLSNASECEKLQDSGHQTRLVVTIAAGFFDGLSQLHEVEK